MTSTKSSPPIGVVTAHQWFLCFAAGVLVAVLAAPFYRETSPWIGVGLFVGVTTIAHYVCSCKYILPVPHVAILFSVLGYILGPWIGLNYPPTPNTPTGWMQGIPNDYFRYAGPVTLAVAFGWLCPALRLPRVSSYITQRFVVANSDTDSALDCLLFGGLALNTCLSFFDSLIPSSLRFLILLLANLRFLGTLGWALTGRPGWLWRTAIVFGGEVMLSASTSFFLDLILWGTALITIYVYRFRPRPLVVVACILFALLLIPGLQHAKWTLRRARQNDYVQVLGEDLRVTSWTRPIIWVGALTESTLLGITRSYSDDFIGENVLRYNQGWIVSYVMQNVPAHVPFARGQTVWDAVIAAVLPRALMPNKKIAGGKENYERYTGLTLNWRTSMNLGYAGEMYANYGYYGGIIACFVYGMFFGILFRWLTLKSYAHPICMAFIPYVLHWSALMEVGLLETFGFTAKACIIVILVQWAFPALRFGSQRKVIRQLKLA